MNVKDILHFNEQRWYVYDNCSGTDGHTYNLILDFKTGLLWVNGEKYHYNSVCLKKESINLLFEHGNFVWRLPTFQELENVATDHSFPLHAPDDLNEGFFGLYKKHVHYLYPKISQNIYGNQRGFFSFYIKNYSGKIIEVVNLGVDPIELCKDRDNCENFVIAVTDEFKISAEQNVNFGRFISKCGADYVDDTDIIMQFRRIYDACISLSVMCQIKAKFGISPVFSDMENKQIFDRLCTEYGTDTLDGYIFDFFDIDSLKYSPNRYCKHISIWVDMLMKNLDTIENSKKNVISDFNTIGLKLGKKYKTSDQLTDEENTLIRDRQNYFVSRFSLDMNSIRSKLLAVKHQADELECRIDEIDSGDDAIHQLALLEKEECASFPFIAENTAKIVRNALKKIEFFESNHQYVVWAIETWEQWTEKYKVFKTTYLEELKGFCEEDGIEDEIWQKWYNDWQSLRFMIEEKVQPIIEKELHEHMAMIEEQNIFVAQQIISKLEIYRNAVDTFYREERKGIYQNFVFQSNGDIQDKLKTKSKLYKLTAQFQSSLQDIIFNCTKAEDRIFILNWASDLLDIQVDDVLSLISDNDFDKNSETILTEFSELKKKNYEIYLADAKSYGEEQERRDNQFNSLLFKMRKGLK